MLTALSVMMTVMLVGGSDPMTSAHTTAGSEKTMKSEDEAIMRAKQLLSRELGISEQEIDLQRLEPRTWPDASMGCRKPGALAATVVTEGHAVTLKAHGREYRVHVSDNAAVLCDQPAVARKDRERVSYARGLDAAIAAARTDLAQRIGADAATIRVIGMRPQRWGDSGLGCPEPGEQVHKDTVNGYKLSLKHDQRVYTYHTDLKTVRACPPIDSR